jgi:hypothetical protein
MNGQRCAGLRLNCVCSENPVVQLLFLCIVFLSLTGLLNGCVGLVTAQPSSSSQTGSFQLSSTSISFGSVSVGKQATQSVTVTNSGKVALNITQAAVSNTQFSISGLTMPLALAVGQSSAFTVGVTPSSPGSISGTLMVTGNSGSSPVIANLSATAVAAQPQLSVGQTSINFGTVTVGSDGTASLVLSNNGSANLTISAVTASGAGFSVGGIATPKTISTGQSAQATVTFSPTAASNATGSITISSNDPTNPTLNVALSGTGSAAPVGQLSANPASLSFGSMVAGTSVQKQVVLSNSGNAAVKVSSIAVSGGAYNISGVSAPLTINPSSSVTLTVTFAPTAAGTDSGSISIASNASDSSLAVGLSGTGVAASPALTANPASLSFGSLNAGSSSSKTVTLTNSGNVSVTLSGVSVSATNFSTSGISTPLTLTAGQSTTLDVSFSPASSENVTGNITVSTSQGATAVIPISGSGVQPALTITPGTATFGNVTVGDSTSQTLQFSNSGTGTLTITQASVSGSGFSMSPLSLPISLPAGQSSSFNVEFAPQAAGAVNGTLTVASNAPGSPSVVSLSGTGVAATLTLTFSTSNLAFGNVNTGSSSALPVTVTNSGNSNVQITQISESGAGFTLSGASTPVTLTPQHSLTFNVTFEPTAAGSDSGTVTVTSNASGSPKTIVLSGAGVAPSHSVALSWTGSTSTVSGYNVYRSTTSGSSYTKINSALVTNVNYTDSTVQDGTTYYYVTTSVDSSGNESAYSNQATAVVP